MCREKIEIAPAPTFVIRHSGFVSMHFYGFQNC